MIYNYKTVSNVRVCGDIHGEFKSFFNKIMKDTIVEEEHPLVTAEKQNKMNKPRRSRSRFLGLETPFYPMSGTSRAEDISNILVIVAGDCGFGFNKPNYYFDLLEKANQKLSEHNIHVLFIRGNHDDPSYFHDNTINYSNIKAISDYSIVQTSTHNILCIGGATSIDRTWRKQQEAIINKYKTRKKNLFWENEGIVFNEEILNQYNDDGITINGVITHSAPSSMFPTDKNMSLSWFKVDPHLKNDMFVERNILEMIYQKLLSFGNNLDFWAYGHFHQSNCEIKTINNHKMLHLALEDSLPLVNPIAQRELLIALSLTVNDKKKKGNKGLMSSFYSMFDNIGGVTDNREDNTLVADLEEELPPFFDDNADQVAENHE